MIKFRIGLLLLMTCCIFSNLKAQRTSDLIINEVLVNNQNSFMDLNGERGAWIEIYNKSAGTVNIAGCYLTIDKSNLKLYPITKGDVRTIIEPHQRIVFYCNSQAHRSVFHTNFSLNPSSTNTICLVSANGKDIIDEVSVPVLSADQSWGCEFDGKKDTRKVLKNATPNAANYVDMGSTAVEKFKQNDPFGIGMALTAMAVVFSALLCLFLAFKVIGKIALYMTKSRARKSGADIDGKDVDTTEVSGEVYAAIAMALNLLEEDAHDYEDTILTMKKVEKRYSPWSSKIYGLRENPSKKN